MANVWNPHPIIDTQASSTTSSSTTDNNKGATDGEFTTRPTLIKAIKCFGNANADQIVLQECREDAVNTGGVFFKHIFETNNLKPAMETFCPPLRVQGIYPKTISSSCSCLIITE